MFVRSCSPILLFFFSASHLIIFSLAPFHSLAILVLYPRAKHISSIGHFEDQWRGKAQERPKSRDGKEEREGMLCGNAIKRRDQAVNCDCNSANMYVQSVHRSEGKSARRFLNTESLGTCRRSLFKPGPVNCG